jgi:glucose/arabinose dehydrogenase
MPLRTPLLAATAIAAAGPVFAQSGEPVAQGAPNAPEFEPAFEAQTRAPAADSEVRLAQETVAEGLVHPWGIAVLPEGGALVTERPGRLRHVAADGAVSEPIAGLPEVHAVEQGGLLDVALGPDFAETRRIYWTYAKPTGGGDSVTAAARGTLSDDMTEVTGVEEIFAQFPESPTPMHYGSRILFDDAGHAFITTGEHFTEEERDLAQDLATTYGKVVRVALDGAVPEDNPFVDQDDAIPSIWSYGHRNIQGADIRPSTGQLWTIEHGPAGGDELNRIEPGENYGWPVITYGENYDGTPVGSGESKQQGMAQPVYYWDPVIAPGGMTFYTGEMFPDWQGDIFISALVSGGLVRLEMDGDRVAAEERLVSGVGRTRDVAQAGDGALLIITDKENGALIRLTPEGETPSN